MAAGAVEVDITTINARQGKVFDGVDDNIDLGINMAGEVTNDFTIAYYVKQDKLDNTTQWHFQGDSAGGNRLYLRNNNSSTGVTIGLSSWNDPITINASSKLWTHFIITLTGTTGKIYQNGILKDTQLGIIVDLPSVTNIFLGSNVGESEFLDGALADFKIYNRGITSAEAALLGVGRPISTNGLIHHWPLIDDNENIIGTTTEVVTGGYFANVDDALAAKIAADRTTANDNYILGSVGGQVIDAVVEEAP